MNKFKRELWKHIAFTKGGAWFHAEVVRGQVHVGFASYAVNAWGGRAW